MNDSIIVLKHRAIMAAMVFIVILLYARVSGAYFCGWDDFLEIRRAAFQDAHEPSLIITTSHWNSFKYRPLNRAMTLLTYRLGEANPLIFRTRNIGFHLLNIILVYKLGCLLFDSASVSSVGAVFFGLHPMVNQTVNGAVWTNTMSHTGFLLALVMFFASLRAKRFKDIWLIAGLVSGWLSLLLYDSGIVVFGLICIYLVTHFFIRREKLVGWRFFAVFASVSGTLLGSYFLLRILFVPHGLRNVTANLPSLGIVGKNVSMYILALLSPVDSVLANEWLHVRLPSEVILKHSIP